MILEKLSLINYKNIREAMLVLSPKINCMNPVDSMLIRHGEEFMLIEGTYKADSASSSDDTTIISCGLKKGTKKHFRRNKKEYRRLSEHIGMIPLVMISPSDAMLIEGGSEERRRLMDMVISQYDRAYMESVNRYNKALQQRNSMLKQEEEPDPEIMSLWEEQMAMEGERIYERRRVFVNELTPIFQRYYECISGNREQVAIEYVSHCQRGPLLDVIQRDRQKDRIMGYSLHGTHRDEQIVKLVAGEEFGQIFITDTNREHLDQILEATSHDYKIFQVEGGEIDV